MILSTLRAEPTAPVGRHRSWSLQGGDSPSLVIGLVNNMPDSALEATERQFRELLTDAAHGVSVQLRCLSLGGIQRGGTGRSYVRQHYQDIGEFGADHVDGLIVTGTEPRAPSLTDEPYWCTLVKLVDWAASNTISTIWSCLAAHAAVLHLDGVERYALGNKLSGLFECVRVGDHPIVAGTPPRWRTPHSRYNGLPEDLLASKGYEVVSRLAQGGVDIFLRQEGSLFLFMQGHPEYDARALLREYRRDVARFLAGMTDRYPEMPLDYLGKDAAAEFENFRQRAQRVRSMDLFPQFPGTVDARRPIHAWRETAIQIYANWFAYLAEKKYSNVGLRRSAVL